MKPKKSFIHLKKRHPGWEGNSFLKSMKIAEKEKFS